MRIWIDRAALAARGLTAQDIETAIKRQNVELPGGRIEFDAARADREDRLAPRDAGGIRAGHRRQQERLSRAPRRGGAGRGRRRGLRASSSTRPAAPPSASASCGNRPPTPSSVADGVRAELERAEGLAAARHRRPKSSYDESQFIRASINGVLQDAAWKASPSSSSSSSSSCATGARPSSPWWRSRSRSSPPSW